MKAYKGFNKDMTCYGGFQYEEGKNYHEDNAKLCNHGFHACEYPLDCFTYFPPAESVFHEVELDGITGEREGDTKICGTDIKIGAKLDIAELVKASFDYVKAHCENNKAGGNRSALAGGDWSALTGGDKSALTGGKAAIMRGGKESTFKGGMWSVFACEIRDNDDDLTGMVTAVVDGKNIKPNAWYKCVDGEFVEVKEDE